MKYQNTQQCKQALQSQRNKHEWPRSAGAWGTVINYRTRSCGVFFFFFYSRDVVRIGFSLGSFEHGGKILTFKVPRNVLTSELKLNNQQSIAFKGLCQRGCFQRIITRRCSSPQTWTFGALVLALFWFSAHTFSRLPAEKKALKTHRMTLSYHHTADRES